MVIIQKINKFKDPELKIHPAYGVALHAAPMRLRSHCYKSYRLLEK